MGRILTVEGKGSGTYIALPRDKAILYAEFDRGGSFRIKHEPEFGIDFVVGKGVQVEGHFKNEYVGSEGGRVLFKVIPLFYREKINPDSVQRYLEGLEKYLSDEGGIDVSSEAVKTTTQKILRQLSQGHRDNPYSMVEGVVHWIKDNIEYTLVPSHIVDNVRKVIESLPEEKRYDPFTILRHSFTIKDRYLMGVANQVQLSREIKDPKKLARELMTQAGNVGYLFQLLWLNGNLTSASATIESKEGKCAGISNTYIALARALGIPSRKLGGYATNGISGGKHAWATSYLHPYGWVEVDPTFGEFEDFDYNTHMYEFSHDVETLPNFAMIENGSKNLRDVERAVQLLSEDKAIKIDDAKNRLHQWDNPFKTRKLQQTIGLEDSIHMEELEYLRRFQSPL